MATASTPRTGMNPQLLALLLAGCILGLSCLFYFIYTEMSSRIREDRQGLMTETAGFMLSHVDEWLDKNIRVLTAASGQPGMRRMDAPEQTAILKAVREAYPWIYLTFTLDADGRNIARSDNGILRDYSDRAYFRALKAGRTLAWQTLIGKTSGQPSLVLALPIVEDGQFAGVIAAAMTTEDISKTVADWRIGVSGFAVLLDEENRVLAHPHRQRESARDLGRHILLDRGKTAGIQAYEDRDGIRRIGVVKENRFGWHLILEQAADEAFREL
ncbi:MAG: cache domain-containing protein, partial [Desulfobacterales bacterium]|nr:cache domain-containing protein [Desulfobacterales bacterium]